jgi:epoxyqueuosine reductase
MVKNIGDIISSKAIEIGYEKCGIIKVESVADYQEKVNERISRIPFGEVKYKMLEGYAYPGEKYPWAKSIIVLVVPYSSYTVPKDFDGMYAKSHMFDNRINVKADANIARKNFGAFLNGLGIQFVTEEKYGLTGVRWAAYKAGLGMIRRNNFFYTEKGSYCSVETFLMDKETELVEIPNLQDCPDNCDRCIEACPTGSLFEPYTMDPAKCVSYHTTRPVTPPSNVPAIETARQFGSNLYGCDICQDVCRFNKGKMAGGKDFVGLNELLEFMRPEKIMEMSYVEIGSTIGEKFWYLHNDDAVWKWKIDALTYMMNQFVLDYEAPIKLGLADSNSDVRMYAKNVCAELGISKNI